LNGWETKSDMEVVDLKSQHTGAPYRGGVG